MPADPDPPRHRNPSGADLLRWDEIPSTRWTLVGRAAGKERGDTGSALEELLHLYLPVLRGHLVTTLRLRADRADDLLQGFLADRVLEVLERNLIAEADASRGRFRRFLLTALNRYVTDMHRRESASKRQPTGGPPLSLEALAEPAAPEPGAAAQFDRLWANEVLREVMRRTRATCKDNNRLTVWAVLEARILIPVTTGMPPAPHRELASQLGMAEAAQSATLLAAGKQLFMQTFRQVVGEYVQVSRGAEGDPKPSALEQAIDEEIRDLWTIFSARR
jgi:RNA polymerase sigma-70 factor (ECF subfamily)